MPGKNSIPCGSAAAENSQTVFIAHKSATDKVILYSYYSKPNSCLKYVCENNTYLSFA